MVHDWLRLAHVEDSTTVQACARGHLLEKRLSVVAAAGGLPGRACLNAPLRSRLKPPKEFHMSIWQRHSIEVRIREILASVPRGEHHFGRPFLGAYQIAIAFAQRYPQAVDHIGKPVGGRDTGHRDSLAKYFANQLSRRILDQSLPDIEGAFLNGLFLQSLEYDNRGETVPSSLGEANMSMFRLADSPARSADSHRAGRCGGYRTAVEST